MNKLERVEPVLVEGWESVALGSTTRFGPELTLAVSLSTNLPRKYARVVMIKKAQNGALIDDMKAGGAFYQGLLDIFGRVAAQYGPDQTMPIGVLWMQGEADSKAADEAANYRKRFHDLISHLRSDMHAPSMPFVVAQMSYSRCLGSWNCNNPEDRPYQDQVEAAYDATAAEDQHIRYVRGPWPSTRQARGVRATVAHLTRAAANVKDPSVNAMDMGELEDIADLICSHYSSSSVLHIGATVGQNIAELQGWAHQSIMANVSSWMDFQDRKEATWLKWPDDWQVCE